MKKEELLNDLNDKKLNMEQIAKKYGFKSRQSVYDKMSEFGIEKKCQYVLTM